MALIKEAHACFLVCASHCMCVYREVGWDPSCLKLQWCGSSGCALPRAVCQGFTFSRDAFVSGQHP